MGDYIFVVIDRLAKRADKLTKDQLVNVFFYFNVCRKRAVDFEYEYALEKEINNMSIDEIAVVAMGYFKSKTKIKLTTVLETMIQRVKEHTKDIHEISLAAIIKVRTNKRQFQLRIYYLITGDSTFKTSKTHPACPVHVGSAPGRNGPSLEFMLPSHSFSRHGDPNAPQ